MPEPTEQSVEPEDPEIAALDPVRLQQGFSTNEALYKGLEKGTIQIPPCKIDGKEFHIFALDPSGENDVFDQQLISDTIIELLLKGKTNFEIEIPGITALLIGNTLNKDRFYSISTTWRILLSHLMPQDIRKRCGIGIACDVEFISAPPYMTIKGIVRLPNEDQSS